MDTALWLSELTLAKVCFVNTYYAKQKIYPIIIKSRHANCFIYTVTGTETYYFKDRALTTPPGTLLFIPKGEEYTTTLDGDESVAIVVDFETVGETVRPFSLAFSQPTLPESSFMELEQLWNKPDLQRSAMVKAAFYRLLAQVLVKTQTPTKSRSDARIDSAVAYLHAHYTENRFKISDIIARSGLSQKYFNTLFHERYGMSPKDYVTLLKIERAKKLLLSGKTSVMEISEQLRFCDIYHFSKVFKAKTGFSPTRYCEET